MINAKEARHAILRVCEPQHVKSGEADRRIDTLLAVVEASPVSRDTPRPQQVERVNAYEVMGLNDLVDEAAGINGAMALWQARTDGFPEIGESWDALSAKYLAVRAVIQRRFGGVPTPRSDVQEARDNRLVGESWTEWVERVTGEVLTGNQTAAIAHLAAAIRAEAQAEHDTLIRAVRRYIKANDDFYYCNEGGEVERHYERLREDAYGNLKSCADSFPLPEGV